MQETVFSMVMVCEDTQRFDLPSCERLIRSCSRRGGVCVYICSPRRGGSRSRKGVLQKRFTAREENSNPIYARIDCRFAAFIFRQNASVSSVFQGTGQLRLCFYGDK